MHYKYSRLLSVINRYEDICLLTLFQQQYAFFKQQIHKSNLATKKATANKKSQNSNRKRLLCNHKERLKTEILSYPRVPWLNCFQDLDLNPCH
jgi:hypothetical protein